MLKREDHQVGYRRVGRIMKEENLLVQVKWYCKTTFPKKGKSKYPNLLKGLKIDHPNQIWCGDLTYVRLRREFVYLAVLMDVFTRGIRGWELSRSLDEQLTLRALDKALQKGEPEIHHSDHGVQYLSENYVSKIKDLDISISLAAKGRPWENSYVERLIRTLKDEEIYLHEYDDFNEALRRISDFIEAVYNQKRPHSALGYRTPAEFEEDYTSKPLQSFGKAMTDKFFT